MLHRAKELDDLVEELALDAPSDAKPEKKSSGAKKVKKKVREQAGGEQAGTKKL